MPNKGCVGKLRTHQLCQRSDNCCRMCCACCKRCMSCTVPPLQADLRLTANCVYSLALEAKRANQSNKDADQIFYS